MFGSSGIQAYAQVGVETGVATADPHRLICMLYDGLLQTLAEARQAMQAARVDRKGERLAKAIRILEEGLRASLDQSRGAQIAAGLDRLYEYMVTRLLTANLRNDTAALDEVMRLITELRDAWQAMPTHARATVNPV